MSAKTTRDQYEELFDFVRNVIDDVDLSQLSAGGKLAIQDSREKLANPFWPLVRVKKAVSDLQISALISSLKNWNLEDFPPHTWMAIEKIRKKVREMEEPGYKPESSSTDSEDLLREIQKPADDEK